MKIVNNIVSILQSENGSEGDAESALALREIAAMAPEWLIRELVTPHGNRSKGKITTATVAVMSDLNECLVKDTLSECSSGEFLMERHVVVAIAIVCLTPICLPLISGFESKKWFITELYETKGRTDMVIQKRHILAPDNRNVLSNLSTAIPSPEALTDLISNRNRVDIGAVDLGKDLMARSLGSVVVGLGESSLPELRNSTSERDFVGYIGICWQFQAVVATKFYLEHLSRPAYLLPITKDSKFVFEQKYGPNLPPGVPEDMIIRGDDQSAIAGESTSSTPPPRLSEDRMNPIPAQQTRNVKPQARQQTDKFSASSSSDPASFSPASDSQQQQGTFSGHGVLYDSGLHTSKSMPTTTDDTPFANPLQ
ncbi:hypothetical protein BGZ83_011116 [Gryganskiella cystojenkinii]|nr:hypothetical protein BGZ83_011116 [Gryganskiella cystojenkinii]